MHADDIDVRAVELGHLLERRTSSGVPAAQRPFATKSTLVHDGEHRVHVVGDEEDRAAGAVAPSGDEVGDGLLVMEIEAREGSSHSRSADRRPAPGRSAAAAARRRTAGRWARRRRPRRPTSASAVSTLAGSPRDWPPIPQRWPSMPRRRGRGHEAGASGSKLGAAGRSRSAGRRDAAARPRTSIRPGGRPTRPRITRGATSSPTVWAEDRDERAGREVERQIAPNGASAVAQRHALESDRGRLCIAVLRLAISPAPSPASSARPASIPGTFWRSPGSSRPPPPPGRCSASRARGSAR